MFYIVWEQDARNEFFCTKAERDAALRDAGVRDCFGGTDDYELTSACPAGSGIFEWGEDVPDGEEDDVICGACGQLLVHGTRCADADGEVRMCLTGFSPDAALLG